VTRYARFAVAGALLLSFTAAADAQKQKYVSRDARMALIRRAQVWMPTDIATLDLKAGPQDAKSFAAGETVTCDLTDKTTAGLTPKFFCAIAPGDEVKVKYGPHNGEVFGEVAATRLLWALGFGADRMYPVKVLCRGCSADPFTNHKHQQGEHLFDPATIERQMPGHTIENRADSGWSWVELSNVDQGAGGAPLMHRDALKLLAVFMQHTDSKSQQQRLMCLDKEAHHGTDAGQCDAPFMMVNDLGRTFGKANAFNRDIPGSVDLKSWKSVPIWKDKTECIGDLPKSWSGSLDNPRISEEGRKFLSGLLGQLSDQQIHDLFEVSRFTVRQPDTTVEDWVSVFKAKRDEIAARTCPQ